MIPDLPLPWRALLLIACIIPLVISLVPLSFWKSLIAKQQAKLSDSLPPTSDQILELVTPKPDQSSAKYLEAQKKLLEIRSICKDCQEATAAIDAAIRATVAMVVKPQTSASLSSVFTFADISKAPVGGVIGTAQVVKGEPLPPRTVDVEAGQ